MRLDAPTAAKTTIALVLLTARRRRAARLILLGWMVRSAYMFCRRGVFREAT